MPRYDEAFVDRFLAPWNRHDVDGALALMTDDCVWEIPRGREPHDAQLVGCSTHPVDGAVGFRTAHRQWLAIFSLDLAREVVRRGFRQHRRHRGDAQSKRFACVAYDVAGNPAASSGECEDHDELVGSQMADAGRALAATSFRFL